MPTWYSFDSFVGFNKVLFALEEVIAVEVDEEYWHLYKPEQIKSSSEGIVHLRGASTPLRVRWDKKEFDDFMDALRIPEG